jgi:hypothetical protein
MRRASRTIDSLSRLDPSRARVDTCHDVSIHMDRAPLMTMVSPPRPVDPTLSADALLAIIEQLYRQLQAAPRQQQPARIAHIRRYADRYWQITDAPKASR